jgi:hypothetical protein
VGTIYTYRVKACTDECSAFSTGNTGYRSADEPVMGGLRIVATELDTINGDLIHQIGPIAGVAINILGEVAFGGQSDKFAPSIFTQNDRVVAEGDILPDDSNLVLLSREGGVAISASQSGAMIAFHGRESDKGASIFTQNGLVLSDGDMLPDGNFIDEIKDQGKIAINDFNLIAFLGTPEDERYTVVFTSEALIAWPGLVLEDDIKVEEIVSDGGIAINDMGEVAFHGLVYFFNGMDNDAKAVFTQHGMVASVGGLLTDETLVSDIDESGGVAINMFGEVVFHGDVLKEGSETETVRAVLSRHGVIAKEGDMLPDGTVVDEIAVDGGVAINFFGDVAFHGRTGGFNAVFTQHGLVGMVGDPLTEATSVGEIHQNGGVAINFFGEVAFHGKVGADTDVVIVGLAPVPVTPSTE